MRVLERFDDVAEAEFVAEYLRDRGILTHMTSNPVGVMGLSPTRSARLWVVLPEQYLDAENCLKDKEYKPFKTLTEDEMDKIQREAIEEVKSSYTNHVAWTVTITVLFIVFFIGIVFWMVNQGI